MKILMFILAVGLFVGLMAIPAWILMILLGVLASLTGWATAIGFWACFVIALIIGLFFNS